MAYTNPAGAVDIMSVSMEEQTLICPPPFPSPSSECISNPHIMISKKLIGKVGKIDSAYTLSTLSIEYDKWRPGLLSPVTDDDQGRSTA